MSGKEMIKGIAFAAVLGGTINGVSALRNGNTFWKGTPPKITVKPITISIKPTGLTEGGKAEIKTGDYKISSTTEPDFLATTKNNTATSINRETGVVKLNPKEFGIRNDGAFDKISSTSQRIGRDGNAVEVIFENGNKMDINAARVKEWVPNLHPEAPAGTFQKVKFENFLPNSKGFKRTPTPAEIDFLNNLFK